MKTAFLTKILQHAFADTFGFEISNRRGQVLYYQAPASAPTLTYDEFGISHFEHEEDAILSEADAIEAAGQVILSREFQRDAFLSLRNLTFLTQYQDRSDLDCFAEEVRP